jgi:hypothetical protein
MMDENHKLHDFFHPKTRASPILGQNISLTQTSEQIVLKTVFYC